jgi:uncharacterized protein (DUF1697 family)
MRQVAFLRAVNLGGRTVKMERLKTSFEALALDNVATFIASGNVIFDSRRRAPALERAIEAQLERDFGFTVTTMIRSMGHLRDVQTLVATRIRPQPGVSLHVGFLKTDPAREGIGLVMGLSNDIDRLAAYGRELYWFAARGVGQSTLSAANFEKLLGTAVTFRNLNTIDRIVARFGNG